MSKVTMPEPDFHVIINRIPRYLFSADQMGFYAAAKVREALEEAAEVAESCVCSCCCSDDQQFTAQDAAQRIRELIK